MADEFVRLTKSVEVSAVELESVNMVVDSEGNVRAVASYKLMDAEGTVIKSNNMVDVSSLFTEKFMSDLEFLALRASGLMKTQVEIDADKAKEV